MKKRTGAVIGMILLASALNACGSDVPEVSEELVHVEKIESDTAEEKPAAQSGVPAAVTLNFIYEDGNPDVVEILDIPGVTDQPDETGHIINGYDENGTLVYKREDQAFDDENGIRNVTVTYEFYSLDHDFDLSVEPLDPENGGNIQTLTGMITFGTGEGKADKSLSFEENGIRGQTGIWYAGICSCRNGKIVDFITF